MFDAQTLSLAWPEAEFVAFDTETTGRYPLAAEICEFAAVRWRDGAVVSRWSTLLKPTQPMLPENVAIHGITNEMVEGAPAIGDVISQIRASLDGAIAVAHHAPFDMGFLAHEFERAGLEPLAGPAICSSLLARKLVPESDNHRLQTLIARLGLTQGTAHRATDDAEACLGVMLFCLERLGRDARLERAFAEQGGAISWPRFSMKALREHAIFGALVDACERQAVVEIEYGGGSKPGEPRRLHPEGVVRSLDGDFLVAYSEKGQKSKRYYLDRIISVKSV